MALGTGSKTLFYSLIGLLNLAVGVMFYTINITPTPVLTTPSSSSPPRARPVTIQPISATQGIPTRIIIPSLSIDLPVGIGSYNPDDGSWTVDTTKAYYANVSMPVNNSNGTTLIYGHAQSTVFETLPQIQPDAEAVVYTDSGFTFRYQLTGRQDVLPNDVSVFTASGPPNLVLQTCIGAYDELRALFSFRLVAIEKI